MSAPMLITMDINGPIHDVWIGSYSTAILAPDGSRTMVDHSVFTGQASYLIGQDVVISPSTVRAYIERTKTPT